MSARRVSAALLGVILASPLVLATHDRAVAYDINRCIDLRDSIVKEEKRLSEASPRFNELKLRVDDLNKRIDALSVQQADDYISKGRVDPNVERQLAQLRAEHKALLPEYKSLKKTIDSVNLHIRDFQSSMQSQGCPQPNVKTPKSSSRSSGTVGTSKTAGSSEHFMTFQFPKGQKVTLKAPDDYRSLTIAGKVGGNLSDVLPPNYYGSMSLDCPSRTGSAPPAQYTFRCNLSVKYYDSADKSMGVLATAQGTGTAGLFVRSNYKSALSIHFDKIVLTDPLERASTLYHVDWNLKEVAQ